MPGAEGISHGNNYRIADPDKACVGSAKWQMAMLYLLLKDDGARAKEILKEAKTTFASKEELIEYIDTFESEGERIMYNEDGTANVKLYENM